MKFLNYIYGNRKGKEAHRIEKDAMNDPFLSDAIEGYDSIPGNHADRIARMQSVITARSAQRKPQGAWKIAVAAVALIVIVGGYFTLMNHESSMLTAHESGNVYIDLYVPEDYVEQKRLELTAIQEQNPKKEVIATSIANISNLHEVITPIEPMRVYLPEGYAQLRKEELHELSNRKENREIKSSSISIQSEDIVDIMPSETPMLASAQNQTESLKEISPVQESLADKIPGVEVRSNKNSTARLAISASPAVKKQITLEGKIVDSNDEPLIGVSVVQKGTNKGTITDIEGNYKLTVDSENTPLTAYYIGYDKVEIPNPQETKIIAMKEDNKTLNEVVVTGYGIQKKSVTTGAVSSISKEKIKKVEPEPISGMAEYKKYLEQNLIYPQNTDCKKGKVIVEFSVGVDGSPTNIKIKKSLCPPFDNEAIRLVKEGPKWRSGNTTTEIDIKF